MSMSCWKCGKEIDSAMTECRACSGETIIFTSVPIQYEIDWSKIKNFEELLQVLSFVQMFVAEGSPAYSRLKPWLKDKPLK